AALAEAGSSREAERRRDPARCRFRIIGFIGFVFQVIIFSILTLTLSILSRRFMKKDAPAGDINDPGQRLVGKTATVLEGFGSSGEGRVIYDGVEWPAVVDGDHKDRIAPRESVTILKVSDGKLVIERRA
ncbi:MAG: hypothetical protein B7Z26_09870, partial [Asticcacaulis sp. 32-58-5]